MTGFGAGSYCINLPIYHTYPSFQMASRAAIITGAGSGIGRAIAIKLAQEGVHLCLAGRRIPPLEEVAAAAKSMGVEALPVSTDVADRESVGAMVQAAFDRFGRIDILANNAGLNTLKRNLKDMDPSDWDRVIEINLTGAYNVFKAALPHLESQGSGLVINISSMAGKHAGTVGGVAYSASKFGMAALNQSINAEFREVGIRSTCIFPGEVDTPILDMRPVAVSDEKREAALDPEDVAEVAAAVARLPDRAIVEEITIFPRRVVRR